MEVKIPSPIAEEDFLNGADQVSAFLFGSPRYRRKIYHLLKAKQNRPPLYRIGSRVCARKTELMAWIKTQEKGITYDPKN